jgi:hypothetical protein
MIDSDSVAGRRSAIMNPVPLDEKLLHQHGPWRRMRRWWPGAHPDKGIITSGWSGVETVEERECFMPPHVVAVHEPSRRSPATA